MRTTAIAVLLWAAACAGEETVLLHEPMVVPAEWVPQEGTVPETLVFNATLGLKRSNAERLAVLAAEVSDPQGPQYLQYPSWSRLGELVRPQPHHTQAVMAWVKRHGAHVAAVHPHGDYVTITATSAVLSRMAGGTFRFYTHRSTGLTVARLTGGVRVPRSVANALDVFTGFTGFPHRQRSIVRVGETGPVTPKTFRANYNISSVPPSQKGNKASMAQFQKQYTSLSDLHKFCSQFLGKDCSVDKFIGDNEPADPSYESALDIQYVMGVSLDAYPTWVYSTPPMDFCGDMTTFGSNVATSSEYPYVISISYGYQGAGFCGDAVETRFAQDVQKMSTLGISVIIASGDDGSGYEENKQEKLSAAFPADVPYCTAVGATTWIRGHSGEEQASRGFSSGGGFSYAFDAPDWQQDAIAAYMRVEPAQTTPYAKGGRATPDVATLGEGFTTVYKGQVDGNQAGTSATAPSFAGIVSILNDACLAESGKSLGFLNKLFYQNTDMFTDITKGNNSFSVFGGFKKTPGWSCQKGWDPVTGLGVPNFPRMLNVVRTACKKAATL